MDSPAGEDGEGGIVEGELGSEDIDCDMEDFPDEWMVLDDMDEEEEEESGDNADAETGKGDAARAESVSKGGQKKGSDVSQTGLSTEKKAAPQSKAPKVTTPKAPIKSAQVPKQTPVKVPQPAKAGAVTPAKAPQAAKVGAVKQGQPAKQTGTQNKTPSQRGKPAQAAVKKSQPVKASTTVASKLLQSGAAKPVAAKPALNTSQSSATPQKTSAGSKQTGPSGTQLKSPLQAKTVVSTKTAPSGVKSSPNSGTQAVNTFSPILSSTQLSGGQQGDKRVEEGQEKPTPAKPGVSKLPQNQSKPTEKQARPAIVQGNNAAEPKPSSQTKPASGATSSQAQPQTDTSLPQESEVKLLSNANLAADAGAGSERQRDQAANKTQSQGGELGNTKTNSALDTGAKQDISVGDAKSVKDGLTNKTSNKTDAAGQGSEKTSEEKPLNSEEDKSNSVKANVSSSDRARDQPKPFDKSKDSSWTRSPARGRSRERYDKYDSSDRWDRDRSRSYGSSRYRRGSRDREFARPGDRSYSSDSRKVSDKQNSSSPASKSSPSVSKPNVPAKRTAAGEKKSSGSDSKQDATLPNKDSAQKEKKLQMTDRGIQTDKVQLHDQGSNAGGLTQEEIKKMDDKQADEFLGFKSNPIEEGLWRFAVRLSPLELADIAQESLRKLLNGAQDCAVFLKNQGTGRKKRGEAKMYFTRMQMTKYAMQKLFQTPITSKKLDVEISRKVLGLGDKKDTVLLDLDLTHCGLLAQTSSSAPAKDASGRAEEKNVHISNVPKGTTQELLFVIFPTALTIQMIKEGRDKGLTVVQFRSSQYAQDIVRCYKSVAINKARLTLTWNRLTRDKLPEPKPDPVADSSDAAKNSKRDFLCFECGTFFPTKANLRAHMARHRKENASGAVKPAETPEDSGEAEESGFKITVRNTSQTERANNQESRENRTLRDVINTEEGGNTQSSDAKRPRLDFSSGQGGLGLSVTVGDKRSVEITQSSNSQGRNFGESQIVQGSEDISDEEENLMGTEAISPEWDHNDSPKQQSRVRDSQGGGRGGRHITDRQQPQGGRNTYGVERSGNRYDTASQRSGEWGNKRAPQDRETGGPFQGPPVSQSGVGTRGRSAERPRSLEKQMGGYSMSRQARQQQEIVGYSMRRLSVSPGRRTEVQRRSRSPIRRTDGHGRSISPPRSKQKQYSRSPLRNVQRRSQSPSRRRREYSPDRQRKSATEKQDFSPVSDRSFGKREQRRSPGRRGDSRQRRSYSPAHRRSQEKTSYSPMSLAQNLTKQVEDFLRQGRSAEGQKFSSGPARQSRSPPGRGGSLIKREYSPPRRAPSPLGRSQHARETDPVRRSHSPGPGKRASYGSHSPPPRASDFFPKREGLDTGAYMSASSAAIPQKPRQSSNYPTGARGSFVPPVTSASMEYGSVKLEPVIPGLDLLTPSSTPTQHSVLDMLINRSSETFRPFPSVDSSKTAMDDSGWWGTDKTQGKTSYDSATTGPAQGGDVSLDLMSLRKEAAKHLASLEKNVSTPSTQSADNKGPRGNTGSTRGTGGSSGAGFSVDYSHGNRPASVKAGDAGRPNWEEPRQQQNAWSGQKSTSGPSWGNQQNQKPPGPNWNSQQGQKTGPNWDQKGTGNQYGQGATGNQYNQGGARNQYGQGGAGNQYNQSGGGNQYNQGRAGNQYSQSGPGNQHNQGAGSQYGQGGGGNQYGRDSGWGGQTGTGQTGPGGNQGGGFGSVSGSGNLPSGPSRDQTLNQPLNTGSQRGNFGSAPIQTATGTSGGLWSGGGVGGAGVLGPRPPGPSGMSSTGMSGTMSGTGISGAGLSGTGLGMAGPGMSASGMSGLGMSGAGMPALNMSGAGMMGSAPRVGGIGNEAWLPPPPRPPLGFSGAPFSDRMPRPFMRPPF